MAQAQRREDPVGAVLDGLLALHPTEIDLSLGRIERLLGRLGHPEARLPSVIHVAGTNGKGSTVAFCRAILEAAGRRVHVYTSPHLVRTNERVRLGRPGGGRLVTDQELLDALREAERVNAGEPITVFEILTAASLLLFAAHPADHVILEVGLGGRLDATNVVARPAVTAITSVSMDHERHLGTTLDAIASEKAGIAKRGVPLVVAPQADAARAAIETAARRAGAPLFLGGQDWGVHGENGRLVYQDEDGLLDLPQPRLVGRHQLVNAGTAVAALRAGRIAPDIAAIERGLVAAEWPARMQRLTSGRLVEAGVPGAELWLDGGHNPGAGEAIAEVLADLDERLPRPLFLVTGMLAAKDPRGFFRPFAGIVRHVFTVPVPGAAAHPSAALAAAAEAVGLTAEPAADVEGALAALAAAWRFEPPPRVVICGSLYLAGDVLARNGPEPA